MTADAPTSPGSTDHVIVVGVDGSESSKEALAWAAHQAEISGSRLRVVMSWQWPVSASWVPIPESVNLDTESRKAVARIVSDTLGDAPVIPVETVVIEGPPALSLVSQSKGADLVVVGSRGHGAFSGMLLGSVSEYVVTHAMCPVLVMRSSKH